MIIETHKYRTSYIHKDNIIPVNIILERTDDTVFPYCVHIYDSSNYYSGEIGREQYDKYKIYGETNNWKVIRDYFAGDYIVFDRSWTNDMFYKKGCLDDINKELLIHKEKINKLERMKELYPRGT